MSGAVGPYIWVALVCIFSGLEAFRGWPRLISIWFRLGLGSVGVLIGHGPTLLGFCQDWAPTVPILAQTSIWGARAGLGELGQKGSEPPKSVSSPKLEQNAAIFGRIRATWATSAPDFRPAARDSVVDRPQKTPGADPQDVLVGSARVFAISGLVLAPQLRGSPSGRIRCASFMPLTFGAGVFGCSFPTAAEFAAERSRIASGLQELFRLMPNSPCEIGLRATWGSALVGCSKNVGREVAQELREVRSGGGRSEFLSGRGARRSVRDVFLRGLRCCGPRAPSASGPSQNRRRCSTSPRFEERNSERPRFRTSCPTSRRNLPESNPSEPQNVGGPGGPQGVVVKARSTSSK